MAEMLRRMVMHRRVLKENRWPSLTWNSVKDILYGANQSLLFPSSVKYGGMSADTASMFVQSALDIEQIDRNSKGRWRLYSKLGDGPHAGLSDIQLNAYACLPNLNDQSESREFVLSARGAWPTQQQTDTNLQKAIAGIVQAVMDGSIE